MVRLIVVLLLTFALAPLHARQGDSIDAIVRDEMEGKRVERSALDLFRIP